jgi:hypothetical protein
MESIEETVADMAICYTFNGFDVYRNNGSNNEDQSHEWSIDGGYITPGTLNMYPRRALGGGSQFGLTVLLRLSIHDFEYRCTRSPGFYVCTLLKLQI